MLFSRIRRTQVPHTIITPSELGFEPLHAHLLSDSVMAEATLEGMRPLPQDRRVTSGTAIHSMSELVVCAPVMGWEGEGGREGGR